MRISVCLYSSNCNQIDFITRFCFLKNACALLDLAHFLGPESVINLLKQEFGHASKHHFHKLCTKLCTES